jgi:hypothetical protein
VSYDDRAGATDLLYPFYLDTDMSMAFAAALSGGVALEAEQTSRTEATSKAVKNLRGSLRLFGLGALDAGADRGGSEGRTDEATLVRKHTTHSIFIALHQELRDSGQLRSDAIITDLEVGDLVSMRLNPAIAPLRRVIDQVLRLLDVMAPALGLDDTEDPPISRQERRQRAREAARAISEDSGELQTLSAIRRLFVALRDDLERSGMVDVVVAGEDSPGVVLTLDKRFADDTALELLHTSNFTVVGKVTQVWPTSEDVVLLYRRSALSLVPALSQQVAAGVFTFLVGMAKAVGVVDLEQQVNAVLRDHEPPGSPSEEESVDPSRPAPLPRGEADGEPDPPGDEDIFVGNDIAALHPALTGPAVQILPLALCV